MITKLQSLSLVIYACFLMPQWVMADGISAKHDEKLRPSRYSHSLAFSPDGQHVLLAYEGKNMKLWELSSGKIIRVFKGHSDAVVAVDFSLDGNYILSGSMDHTMKLWDTLSGRVVRTFKGHTAGVASVVFSSDGRYALSGSEDRNMKLWEITSGKEARSFKGYDGYVGSAVAFSPDEKSVLMGNTLWDKSTGKEIRRFKSSGRNGYWKDSVKFSSDGKYVWIGETFLEVATGKAVVALTGIHGRLLHHIFAYSPDGSYVVSGGGGDYGISSLFDVKAYRSPDPAVDRTVHLRPVINLESERWPITAMAISPDSKYLLVRTIYLANRDPDTLTLWDINDTDEPVRYFKAR